MTASASSSAAVPALLGGPLAVAGGPAALPAFQHELRVYWEDTDAGGVVFYANYLKFMERARTEWLRGIGFEQEAMRRDEGLMFVVSDTALRYLAPARLDDWLRVSVEPSEIGRASLTFDQQVFRGDQLLTQGRIRIGCVDALSLKPARIPARILAALQGGPADAGAVTPSHG
ncbi:tol-pal system-associated acyl-CoA thioesterase [Mitsuaria sp. GD03876]|uniref:tol-pal system-associated acyl-CoA thioesterase n=1 Tax=Mitsuaria sp. GD03876 TaxID=2975399 RepID=UPI002446A02A|nr:tol-pal system-associated acyl-CoA thioesterase [Mitsuaria sp. GD03876]MDH0866695.1 tol-pal system-associated acyl-CoA thioesterase [Mitsuaria sp. GD03876]